ncbi:HDOD domain-containing protein [Desulfopila sp. IMCC35008]|uniref:HDOD domain-containing protein n=1 Tax=Desulfopila sp. IMCC35008 TaxID=2653858 RepID=UPI0013D052D9|nr:HDOD domain-containing protein [Desulfopila sp. IMCC35008]
MTTTPQELIEEFSNVQTLPHVVTQLTQLIADSNTTMKQFEEVIEMDPVLVARLLKIVNSPMYGLMQKVDSIGRAVAYLGMKNLNNIAITDALMGIFMQENESDFFSRNKLWLHCAAVSICSKMVAERIFGINGDDAYLCGILHDFGIIVEEQVRNEQFFTICRDSNSSTRMLELEQEQLGTDHCELGYILTGEWSMDESIRIAIRDHHSLLDNVEPQSLLGILQIAEYLTTQLDFTTLPGIKVEISEPLLTHLEENIDEYRVLLEDFPDEMTKAQALYGGGTS